MNINLCKTDITIYYLLLSLTIIFCYNPQNTANIILSLSDKPFYYEIITQLHRLNSDNELYSLEVNKSIMIYTNTFLNLARVVKDDGHSNNHSNEKFHFEGEIKVKKKRKDGPKRML